ncbi:6-carboxyhexanoate--CoA ligase [Hydrogenivirga sp. 128-5-R1-1]|uniref:6-carboxyhexanoate--CoA ligase n=1 Tax=Hydrogenivirga sp. 128-5-R1-1 TaxID=392423 RepID=UPI000682E522
MLSVRMRASLSGRHVSGAERLVGEEELTGTLCELLRRPGKHDFLKITVERVEEVHTLGKPLPVSSYEFGSVEEARKFARTMLVKSGVPEEVARLGIELLSSGANPEGGNMRGAVLLDTERGDRLEPDQRRGIRTVRVDWKDRSAVRRELLSRGFTERTLDALAIATKNINCGVVAELCWSDDPDYVTGYVASGKLGYIRITPLKEEGDPLGGRIYFIRREKVREVVECLEGKAFLIGC